MIQKYKEWLETIQRLSPNTIQSYLGRIEILSKHLNLNELDEAKINQFLIDYTKDKSRSTFNGYINTISSLLKFLKKDIKLYSQVVIKGHTPNYITEKEFSERVIPVIEYYCDNDVLQMKSLLYFMFYTGARLSDIKNLKRQDLDFKNKYVTFRSGKGDKDRDVPLLDLVIKLTQSYFNIVPEDFNAFNININTLRRRLVNISEIIGDLKFTAHTLRHSYAMWYLNDFNGNIRNLQLNMGHNDIKTTMKYLNIKNKDRLETFKSKEKEWTKRNKRR